MPKRQTIERIAESQSRFREANEQIEATADRMKLVGPIPFVCECPAPACTDIVRMSLDDYEAVRQHDRRFFVAPGHQDLAVSGGAGEVVGRDQGGRFVVVDKIGIAGEIAAERYRALAE